MKYLVLVLVVVLVVWLARAARKREQVREDPPREPGRADGKAPPGKASPAQAAGREALPACAHCGVHLPSSDAWPGRGGVYCSEAHRRIAESGDGTG